MRVNAKMLLSILVRLRCSTKMLKSTLVEVPDICVPLSKVLTYSIGKEGLSTLARPERVLGIGCSLAGIFGALFPSLW